MYVLASETSRRTYVGVTNNFTRRLRQHNGEIKGGAKATRAARPWKPILHVCGLDKKTALRLEWRMHHCHKGRGLTGRIKTLYAALFMIEMPEFTIRWYQIELRMQGGFLPDTCVAEFETVDDTIGMDGAGCDMLVVDNGADEKN